MWRSQNINDLFVQAFAIQYSITALCPDDGVTRQDVDLQKSWRWGEGFRIWWMHMLSRPNTYLIYSVVLNGQLYLDFQTRNPKHCDKLTHPMSLCILNKTVLKTAKKKKHYWQNLPLIHLQLDGFLLNPPHPKSAVEQSCSLLCSPSSPSGSQVLLCVFSAE